MPTSDTIYGVRGVVTGSSDGSDFNLTLPAGTIAGDYLLMCVTIWGHAPDGNMGPTITSGQGTRFNNNGSSGGGFVRTDSNLTYYFDIDSSDIALGYITVGNPGNTVPLPSGMLAIMMTLDNSVLAEYSSFAGFDENVANPANQTIAFISHLYTSTGQAPTNSDMVDVQSVHYPGGDGLGVLSVGFYANASSAVASWNPVGTVDSSGAFICRTYYAFFVTPPPFHIEPDTPASVLVTPGTPDVHPLHGPFVVDVPASVVVTGGEPRVFPYTILSVEPDAPVSVLVTPGTPEWEMVGNRGLLIETTPASVLVTPGTDVSVIASTAPFIIEPDSPASVLVTAGSATWTKTADEGTDMTLDFFGEVAAAAVRNLVISGRVVSGIGVRSVTGPSAIQTPVHYFV